MYSGGLSRAFMMFPNPKGNAPRVPKFKMEESIHMKKDYMITCKLIRYGLNFRLQLSMGLFFLIVGLLVEILTKGASFIGGFYMILSLLCSFQCIISTDVSTLVQSSPYKRKIQVVFPYLFTMPLILLAFTLVVVLRLYFVHLDPETYIQHTNGILVLGGVLGLTILYFGFAYKYFVASSIVFACICCSVVGLFSHPAEALCQSLPLAIAVSYLMILVSSLLSYLFSSLLYRRNLSRTAFMQKGSAK